MKNKYLFTLSLLLMGSATMAQEALTLKESIAYGLKNNRSITISANNKLQAKQKAREALAAYLPQVNINATLDDNLILPVTIIPAGTFGPGTPEQKVSFGTQYNSSQSVQLDQPIYDQASITGLKAREPNVRVAEISDELNNQDIIYNIATAYFKIMISAKQIDLLKDNKERMERTLEITNLRVAEGVDKKIDIKQVQVNISNMASQISIYENAHQVALNNLKFSMGMPMSEPLALEDTARWLNTAPTKSMLPDYDYKNTLDYKLQQTQLTLLDINRKHIKDGGLPTLGFYARYGASGFGNNLGDAYSKVNDFAAIGLKLNWNIFGGFRRKAQYNIATIDYNNALENLRLREDQQSLQFQNAGSAYYRAQSTIENNKKNMEMANEVYNNVIFQHKEGVASLTELLNAENSYREAQNNYIQSLLDFYLAELDLNKAKGTLDEYYSHL